MSKFIVIYVQDWQGLDSIETNINIDEISAFNKTDLKMKNGDFYNISDQTYRQIKESLV